MSRHSKNSTANACFTYHEKKVAAREYGTKNEKIGKDSQRMFDQCNLCNFEVKDPVTCLKGHMFCKECILDNLVKQKKNIKFKLEQFEKRQENAKKVEMLRKRELSDLERKAFEQDYFQQVAVKKVNAANDEMYLKTNLNEKEKKIAENNMIVDKIKTKSQTFYYNDMDNKSRLIQSSFWMPESDTQRKIDCEKALELNPESKPCSDMLCPADNAHKIKVKTLYPLKLEKVEGSYNCFNCKKRLMFQKIKALLTCGHAMCSDCVVKYCTNQEGRNICVCGKEWKTNECVNLTESMSGFTFHNDTEVKMYRIPIKL